MKNILLALTLLLLVLTACTDGEQMRRQLQELQARNQADSLLTDLPLATSLCDYFDSHGSPNERMLAHYLLGRTHADRGESPEALEAYHDAAECADTTASDCDYKLLARVHGQSSNLFLAQNLPYEMLEELNMAHYFARKGNDTLAWICYQEWTHVAYDLMGEKEKALHAIFSAYEDFHRYGYHLQAGNCSSAIFYYLVDIKRFDEAKSFIDEFEHHSSNYHEGIVQNGSEIYYYYKGLYFTGICMPDSAAVNYYKLLHCATTDNHFEAAYKGLYNLYKVLGLNDSVARYADLCYRTSEESFRNQSTERISQMQSLYNYSHFRELSNRKTLEAKNLHMQMAVFVFMAFIVVLLLIFAYFHQVSKKRMLRQRMNAKYTADILSFLKICSDLEEIKNKDEKRRQELEAEMAIIKQSLSEVQEDQKSPDQWDVSLKLLEAPIVRHFHQMAAQGNTVSDEKWQELRSLCNVALPGFLESLAATGYYPNLVETQICLLIKLRFLMSEISTIVRLSPSALSNKRVRMLKKMYRTDGSSSDFDEKIRLLRFGSS